MTTRIRYAVTVDGERRTHSVTVESKEAGEDLDVAQAYAAHDVGDRYDAVDHDWDANEVIVIATATVA